MPTTRESIDLEKQSASDTLESQIKNAQDEKLKTGNAALGPKIQDMLDQKALNDAQEYAASLKEEDMKAALKVLKTATADMKKTADQMVGATKIIAMTGTLVAGGAKVVTILKTGKS